MSADEVYDCIGDEAVKLLYRLPILLMTTSASTSRMLLTKRFAPVVVEPVGKSGEESNVWAFLVGTALLVEKKRDEARKGKSDVLVLAKNSPHLLLGIR